MRKITSLMFALIFGLSFLANAQDAKSNQPKGYQFTDIKRLPATSVKDQARAGTCWSWSGISFFESEMIRMGKEPIDLSAMYIVRHAYSDKATKFVRLHGSMNFAVGGAFCDVMHVIKNYGIVPMDVYKGLNYGEPNHAFGEIDDVLAGYVNAVIKNSNKKLSTAWKKGFDGILDAYLGEEPEKFEYKGKEYTPRTFADEVVGLNMDDYVSLTSFTHHPFYSQFAIEVPDNWLWGMSYNLPIDELAQVMSNAIDNGYTFAWASDVSERGFQTSQPGVAVVPTTDTKEMSGAEIAKWEAMPKGNQTPDAFRQGPAPEKEITQEMRQQEFDNYLTTDDHGMHVIGKAKDQNGTVYYIVKNSWNQYNKFGGYFYASEPFMKYKTMNIIVHKNAIPKDIRKKLGIK
ncbi:MULTISPECIES: aminopeptidase C [Butyricimonas]|jgi:aminopeptidase C|uniref:Aminopeptidase n=1 Tax=Butyricimonas faecihominis TaxID=1472416 RepID=A0A7W6MXG8_9BACT|nr:MULTISPECIES: C1 family peptidase [Butyricimonas]KAB1504611.1 aminopeptidase [Butyricimonas faecihominis]MBB4025009.1 bleomycin hydrolase [Butyricimonas faecihominis]WOF08551.1 aminopeptidase [Butyricimonas faecihominis]